MARPYGRIGRIRVVERRIGRIRLVRVLERAGEDKASPKELNQ